MTASIRAGQSFLPIDEMSLLKLPFGSVRREEISNARTSTGNRLLQHVPCHLVEPLNLGDGKSARLGVRMQAGSKENFIGVDISNSGDRLLMHQQWLQPTMACFDQSVEVFPRDRQWIAAKAPGEIAVEAWSIQKRQTAKSAGVPVPQRGFPPAYKRHLDMNMLGEFRLGGWKE